MGFMIYFIIRINIFKKMEVNMSIIFDIVIIVIFVIMTFSGIRKGLIKSLADFLGAVIAAILASSVAVWVSEWIFNSFIRQGIYDRVSETLKKEETREAVSSVFETLPDFFVDMLSQKGINEITVATQAVGTKDDISNFVVNAISPVFILMVQFFAMILLFILFLILIRFVASIVTKLFSIPILAQLNALLGGVFGFLFSVIITWLAISLLMVAIGTFDQETALNIENAVNNSYLAKYIFELNPFAFLIH